MALPDYLQEAGKDFAKQLTAQTAVPIKTDAFMGRQFVAGEDPLQTQAINLATQGIGSFQPFLQGAQQAIAQGAQDSLIDQEQVVYSKLQTLQHNLVHLVVADKVH
jgi:hypothetical protein